MRSKTEQGCSSSSRPSSHNGIGFCLLLAEHSHGCQGSFHHHNFSLYSCNFQICIRECYMKNYSREQQKRGVMFLESSYPLSLEEKSYSKRMMQRLLERGFELFFLL
jgi:hypothetical protein